MEKNYKVISACSIVSAICAVSICCRNFYSGRTALGVLWATLTLSHMVLAMLNYNISKKQ